MLHGGVVQHPQRPGSSVVAVVPRRASRSSVRTKLLIYHGFPFVVTSFCTIPVEIWRGGAGGHFPTSRQYMAARGRRPPAPPRPVQAVRGIMRAAVAELQSPRRPLGGAGSAGGTCSFRSGLHSQLRHEPPGPGGGWANRHTLVEESCFSSSGRRHNTQFSHLPVAFIIESSRGLRIDINTPCVK